MTFIVGHRGAKGIEPENTITSFKKALEIGVEYVECDVHLSADGYPVVIHDDTLDRTTSGKGKVREYTLRELKNFDAGKGERIPTLEEVLELVKGKARLIIEIKEPEAKEVVLKTIKKKDLKEEVLLASFDSHLLMDISSDFSKVLLSYRNPSLFFYVAKEISVSFLGLKYTLITSKVMDRAKKNNLKLLAWTVNERENIKKMLDLNVDAIASDYPDRVRKMIDKREVRNEG